jgi:hypothetical protein
VTLTVTDSDGLTGTASQEVTVTRPQALLSIERISRNRATFEFAVDLTWSGLAGNLIELHRNGIIVDLPNNDGAQRDVFRRYETSFTWKACELQSDFCSNEVSVVFGSSFDGDVATITQRENTMFSTRTVKIVDMN